MSWRFNSCTVTEDSKEAKLKCRLQNFNPSYGSHSAYADVSGNKLVVTANMDGKQFELKVANIDVGNEAVNCKPEKDLIKVIIKKPHRDYSLQGKMPN